MAVNHSFSHRGAGPHPDCMLDCSTVFVDGVESECSKRCGSVGVRVPGHCLCGGADSGLWFVFLTGLSQAAPRDETPAVKEDDHQHFKPTKKNGTTEQLCLHPLTHRKNVVFF